MSPARLSLFGAALAVLVLPGHPLTLLSGAPFDLPALVLAVLVVGWALALPGAPPRAAWIVGGLVGVGLLRLIVGGLAPAYGLDGTYRLSDRSLADGESSPFADRVEPRLDFRGDTFPLHFVNNVRYLNFYTPNQPKRDLLPIESSWTGLLVVSDGTAQTLTLSANGPATLELGTGPSAQRVAIDLTGRVREAPSITVSEPGLIPIAVTYQRPAEAMPWLVVNGGDPRREAASVPLRDAQLVRTGTSPAAVARDAWLLPLAMLLDAALVGLLLTGFLAHVRVTLRAGVRSDGANRLASWRAERPLLAAYFVVAVGLELFRHLHLFGRAVILSGGNDWLAYEGFARDLIINGPLLTEGRALGQGLPFYYQPLYIYWISLTHLVLGESLFAPLFTNTVLGVTAGVGLYFLTRELFGRTAAIIAVPLFELYRLTVFAPTAGLLLSENLLFPLLPLLLLALVRLTLTGRLWTAVLVGFLFGLAGLARTTPLALLPPALLILVVAWRRIGIGRFKVGGDLLALGWRAVAVRLLLVVAVCTLTVGMATLRNFVVSGRPVPITSSAGANLWETHRPSDKVDLSRIDRDPFYERLGLDRTTREVLEFIRQDPAGYVGTLVPMFLFAVGVVGAVEGRWDLQPLLFGLWIGYLVVTLLVRQARALPTWFLHAFIWSHLAQMTIFFSHQYGFRSILPMYVAMAPIVAVGLAVVVLRLGRLLSPLGARLPAGAPLPPAARASILLVAVLGGAAGLGTGDWRGHDAAREAFYGLNGDAAIAVRQAARPDLMMQADSTYFVGDDSRSTDVAYLNGLAFPTLRWFDGARGLVLPPQGEQALYVVPDRAAADFARRCLGDGAAIGRERDTATGAGLELLMASAGVGDCADPREPIGAPLGESVEPMARLLGLEGPASIEPGRAMDVLIHWEALERPRNRARPFVRLVDGKGRRWGQAETLVYPSSAWRPGERAIGTARIDVDPTLPPGEYRLEGGFTVGSSPSRLTEGGDWGDAGLSIARGPVVRLVSRSAPLSPDALTLDRRLDTVLDGIRLIGYDLDRESARAGERVKVTLYWESAGARIESREIGLAIRPSGGTTVQTWRGVPVDGTYPTSAWKPGEIVRDTWELVLPASLGAGAHELVVGLAAPGAPIAQYLPVSSIVVQAADRELDQPEVRARLDTRFSGGADLLGVEYKGRRVRAGDTASLTLFWRAEAKIPNDLTVAVALLDEAGRVLVGLESEPAGGNRPTSGWLPDEYIEDEWKVRVPRDLPPGRNRLAVSLIDPVANRRVLTESGQTWVELPIEVGSE